MRAASLSGRDAATPSPIAAPHEPMCRLARARSGRVGQRGGGGCGSGELQVCRRARSVSANTAALAAWMPLPANPRAAPAACCASGGVQAVGCSSASKSTQRAPRASTIAQCAAAAAPSAASSAASMPRPRPSHVACHALMHEGPSAPPRRRSGGPAVGATGAATSVAPQSGPLAGTRVAERGSTLAARARGEGRKASGGRGRGRGRGGGGDSGGEPSSAADAALDGDDVEGDWGDPLAAGFPSAKFIDEDDDDIIADAEDEDEEDILPRGDYARRTIGKALKSDQADDEGGEDDEGEDDDAGVHHSYDELGDDDDEDDEDEEDFDEDEDEHADAAALGSGDSGARYDVDSLDYASAVRERDSVRAESEIVRLSPEQLRVYEDERRARSEEPAAIIPDNAEVDVNEQGYQAFNMDGIDFLVAESRDGCLNLSDCYYYDPSIAMYARPATVGAIPSEPLALQIIPWVERRSADTLKYKPSMAKMKKVYMLGVASPPPDFQPRMDEVYCFQASSRTLSRCEVKTIGKPKDPVLRIRADGITIEEKTKVPTPSAVSLGTDGRPAAELTEEERQLQLQERIEELEAQAEAMDELDDVPDIPMSDMM